MSDRAKPTHPKTIQPIESRDADLQRFDPMLRALVSFGLVEREGGAGGDGPTDDNGRTPRWRLIPALQRRLEVLATPAPPVDKVIYFGHRCGSCGNRAPTRMRAGVLLCDTCRQAGPAGPEPGRGRNLA